MNVQSYITTKWKDDRLAWNPADFDGFNRTFAAIDELWVPDITIYNSWIFKSNAWIIVLTKTFSGRNWMVWTHVFQPIASFTGLVKLRAWIHAIIQYFVTNLISKIGPMTPTNATLNTFRERETPIKWLLMVIRCSLMNTMQGKATDLSCCRLSLRVAKDNICSMVSTRLILLSFSVLKFNDCHTATSFKLSSQQLWSWSSTFAFFF